MQDCLVSLLLFCFFLSLRLAFAAAPPPSQAASHDLGVDLTKEVTLVYTQDQEEYVCHSQALPDVLVHGLHTDKRADTVTD